jgi:hypothetical protein
MNSHNHPALTSIGAWLWRWLAGIRIAEEPGEPGYGGAYAHLTLAPYEALVSDHARISAAHARLPTSHGVVELSWAFDAATGKLELNTTLPVNTAATIKLPSSAGRGWAELCEGAEGAAIWKDGASQLRPGSTHDTQVQLQGLHAVWQVEGGDHLTIMIGGGRYSFAASLGAAL